MQPDATKNDISDVADFYNISVENQLIIILSLIDKIMSRESFLLFILDTTEINTAVQDLKSIESEVFILN